MLCLIFFCSLKLALGGTNAPGLAVTFSSIVDRQSTDTIVLPNFALYIAASNSPTPLLSPGQFTAAWEGIVSVDLRSEYFFSADLSGGLKLEVNGTLVFDQPPTNSGLTPGLFSKAIRLNKGANPVKAVFTSPKGGHALLRIGWTEKGTNTMPIPPSALSHSDSAAVERSHQLALGRELFIEHRCAKCHIADNATADMQMDAPGFDELDY